MWICEEGGGEEDVDVQKSAFCLVAMSISLAFWLWDIPNVLFFFFLFCNGLAHVYTYTDMGAF
jgi:hypothetical protein